MYYIETYHPHLEDCYFCHCEWSEDNQPIGWFEHFICSTCNTRIEENQKATFNKA